MSSALRAALVGLVLANLAFVHLTEATSWTWLGPLVALTLASPWLVRLTRYLPYRLAWNLGVLGVFALLVHHFTSRGVRFLLEDGLLLAALCQVHLLNNVGNQQKPDLLFFNSFLIAVVTAFLSLDLGYSAIFLVHAPLVVVALQLLALQRAGVDPTGRVLRRTVLQGLVRGTVVVGLTLVAFFVVPRDFQRKGLLGDRLRFRPPAGLMQVGFSDEVELDRSGNVVASDRVVMRVVLESGNQADVLAHWRGATLGSFDGNRWYATNVVSDPLWRTYGQTLVRAGGTAEAHVTVTLADTRSQRLFLPRNAQSVRMRATSRAPTPCPDGTVRCGESAAKLDYRVGLWRDGQVRRNTRRPHLGPFLEICYGSVPRSLKLLAKRIRESLPDDAAPHQVIEAMRAYLFTNYRYLPPGADGGARDLAGLIEERRGAHCEVFASALVMMLRSQRIPARLVTGYRSTEWDEEGRVLTVRARHAHAWVEAWDPRAGWITVDPTPAGDGDFASASSGWTSRLRTWASGLWVKVTGFNDRARGAAVAWLRALPGRLNRFILARPLGTIGFLLLLGAAAWAVRRRRRKRVHPAVLAYRDCLRRFKLAPASGETPREMLARVAMPDDQKRELAAATEAHEQARYAR